MVSLARIYVFEKLNEPAELFGFRIGCQYRRSFQPYLIVCAPRTETMEGFNSNVRLRPREASYAYSRLMPWRDEKLIRGNCVNGPAFTSRYCGKPASVGLSDVWTGMIRPSINRVALNPTSRRSLLLM